MKLIHVFKGKFLATVLVSLTLIGGATAVFAASPAGQNIVHSMTHSQSGAATPDVAGHKNKSQHNDTGSNGSNATTCPGLPEVKDLATRFGLSTASTSDAVQAICALHQGTFKGTTPTNVAVTSGRVFGFGEIALLLTYAQFLAAHTTANAGGKLADATTRSYLAEALQRCGTTALETCLQTNVPGFKPGANTGSASNAGDQHSNQGHDNSHGKPTSTPTPHH